MIYHCEVLKYCQRENEELIQNQRVPAKSLSGTVCGPGKQVPGGLRQRGVNTQLTHLNANCRSRSVVVRLLLEVTPGLV